MKENGLKCKHYCHLIASQLVSWDKCQFWDIDKTRNARMIVTIRRRPPKQKHPVIDKLKNLRSLPAYIDILSLVEGLQCSYIQPIIETRSSLYIWILRQRLKRGRSKVQKKKRGIFMSYGIRNSKNINH